jgi:hypothetical protein
MKFSTLFLACLGSYIPYVIANAHDSCNVSQAYSILHSLSTASTFCSTLIYPFGPIKTKVTVTETVQQYPCKTKNDIKTIHTAGTTTKL